MTRLADSTPWADNEIARLRDHLAVLEHRNAELVYEMGQLRKLLFEERACNDVTLRIERVFGAALEDAKATIVG
jgi:hypothetical protein